MAEATPEPNNESTSDPNDVPNNDPPHGIYESGAVRLSEHKPLRLLHILNHLSDRGNGIINLAVDLALEQRALGHTVRVRLWRRRA